MGHLAIEGLLVLLVQALEAGLGLIGQSGDLAGIILHLLPQRLHLRALGDRLAALMRIRQLAGLLANHTQEALHMRTSVMPPAANVHLLLAALWRS